MDTELIGMRLYAAVCMPIFGTPRAHVRNATDVVTVHENGWKRIAELCGAVCGATMECISDIMPFMACRALPGAGARARAAAQCFAHCNAAIPAGAE